MPALRIIKLYLYTQRGDEFPLGGTQIPALTKKAQVQEDPPKVCSVQYIRTCSYLLGRLRYLTNAGTARSSVSSLPFGGEG